MYKNIKLALLALGLGGATASVGAEDLMQIYQQAQQADPTMAIAGANKGVSEAGVGIARAPLLPQLGASLSYGHSDSRSSSVGTQQTADGGYVLVPTLGDSQGRSRAAQATLTQSLFDWGNFLACAGANHAESAEQLRRRVAGSARAHRNRLFRRVDRGRPAHLRPTQPESAGKAARPGGAALRGRSVGDHRRAAGASQHDPPSPRRSGAERASKPRAKPSCRSPARNSATSRNCANSCRWKNPVPTNLQAWVDLALKQSPVLASSQFSLTASGRAQHLGARVPVTFPPWRPHWCAPIRHRGARAAATSAASCRASPGNAWSTATPRSASP